MMEFADTSPDVNVLPEEYNRLLGFPRNWVLGGRSQELAGRTRVWSARNGRPWVYARQADVDAYLKPMNTKLEDGTPVRCKRRGLKITLTAGEKKGEGLLRRRDVGPDPVAMLDAALQEAAQAAGIELTVENGAIFPSL